MGPRLLCGLAACASLVITMPAAAASGTAKPGNAAPRQKQNFIRRAGAIVAVPAANPDRISSFKLTPGPRQPARQPSPASQAAPERSAGTAPLPTSLADQPRDRPFYAALASAIQISADPAQRRSLTLGFDSGPSSDPLSEAKAHDARTAMHDMAPAGACMGRMPAFSCGAGDDGTSNDSVLSLGLAYTF